MDAEAVCRRDAGALLSAVLQRVDAEERDAGYVLPPVINSHHTAGFASGVRVRDRWLCPQDLFPRKRESQALRTYGTHSLDPLP